MFVVPFLTAMVVAYALSTLLPGTGSTAGSVARWFGIVVVASVAMRIAERFARRFLLLSTMLELSFPDQAPSRFSVAMRAGTAKYLSDRIDAARTGRDGETPAESAERLLELVGLLSHHDRLTRDHSERVSASTHLATSKTTSRVRVNTFREHSVVQTIKLMLGRTESPVQRWRAHPVASRLVRVAMLVLPFVTAMIVAYTLSMLVPGMSSTPGTIVRWVGIIVTATAAMRVAERCARRLLPLSTLLELTLVFPDQAPSRFSLAMRTGTTKHLAERIDAARKGCDDETPAEAAERLLELIGLLSHHDRLTRGHSERVRAYTHLLGTELGLTESELDKIRWAGLLHDVGKTAIPSEILNKPGKLTDEEYAIVKTHPEAGKSLVTPLEGWLGESLRAVWEHHEKFDGTGYPLGLQGTEISMAARIVAVADVYDVITSARSYKQPLSAAEARQELIRCAGTHFDPVVVRAFMNISLGRLRLMTGPAAWLTQFTLFQPGVVQASGGAGASSGAAVSAGAGGAGVTSIPSVIVTSTTAASTGAASAAGGISLASVLSSAAAVTMGVASGATGVALSDVEQVPPADPVAAVVQPAAPRSGDDVVEEIRLMSIGHGTDDTDPVAEQPVADQPIDRRTDDWPEPETPAATAPPTRDVVSEGDTAVPLPMPAELPVPSPAEATRVAPAEPDRPEEQPSGEGDGGSEATVPASTGRPPESPPAEAALAEPERSEDERSGDPDVPAPAAPLGPPESTPSGKVPGPPASD